MLKDIEWPDLRRYKSTGDHQPLDFFLSALSESVSLDILLGYFSSSAISLLSLGFSKFIYNGGVVRLVINDIVSENDKTAILRGLHNEVDPFLINVNDIKSLRASLDEYGAHFFECLAWLIAHNRLEIKIIRPKLGRGISHYKKGVFGDRVNKVGFSGSCNFTAYGIIENLESLDVMLSWDSELSSLQIKDIDDDFMSYFKGDGSDVEYVDAAQLKAKIQSDYGGHELDELVVREKELIYKKKEAYKAGTHLLLLDRIMSEIDAISFTPRFPYSGVPRNYQKEAYSNWKNNGMKGIFAMATGTGKTITALNCLLEETIKDSNKTYHGLILVPTITLVDQWSKEVKGFNFTSVFTVSSKENWQPGLSQVLNDNKYVPQSFVIVCTYDTFVADAFQQYVSLLPSDTLLIADEAHNIGRPTVLQKLGSLDVDKRIALSATPNRVYDAEGSAAIELYFNDKPPYVYRYTLKKAIDDGILCEYDYFPHLIRLNNEEQSEYKEITFQIAKLAAIVANDGEESHALKMLYLRRKRIIHRAGAKLPVLINVLKSRLNCKSDLRYTFIYAPEGYRGTTGKRIIDEYIAEISNLSDDIVVNKFTAESVDREELLKQFEQGRIHVLASMKCLDEGVDLPRAEVAVFCSSTGNPRQFIQRRGRILRRHIDKSFAVIHDLVVIPNSDTSSVYSAEYKVEQALVRSELERVMYFASLSRNPFYADSVFKEICEYYQLNLYTIQRALEDI